MGLFLRIANGDREGETIPLDGSAVITLGRDQETTIQLHDRKLSRIHCQVAMRGDECILTDLNSTNGTLVNGKRVEQKTLRPGDIIRIGLTEIHLRSDAEAGDAPPASPPAAPEADAAARCSGCERALTQAMLDAGEVRKVGSRLYCTDCRPSFGRRPSQEAAAPEEPGEEREDDEPIVEVQPPESFAGIHIVEKAGNSFFGHLYKVEQEEVKRAMLLLLVTAGDRDWHERLARAVYESGRLIHANILLTYDTGYWEGLPYVAWEYAAGRMLAAQAAEAGPRPLAEAVPLVTHLAMAIESSAEQGVHHGLLCPDFVIVTEQRIAKVFGFGLGGLPAPRNWKHRFPLAALPYRAPEQVEGEGAVSFATDVYSVGAIFFHLLTGRPPFTGESYEEISQKIRHTDNWPAMAERLGDKASWGVARVIERCMAPRAAARYPRAKDMLIELEGLARS